MAPESNGIALRLRLLCSRSLSCALSKGSARTVEMRSRLSRRGLCQVAMPDLALDQRDELGEFGMLRAHAAHVLPHARQVTEITALAVAVPQPAEDAEHLDVPLQAHQVEPALPAYRVNGSIQHTGIAHRDAMPFRPR